jgi:nicotinamidase-related amidase
MPTPALVVVDMQRYFCEPDSVLARLVGMGVSDGGSWYFDLLRRRVVPNISRLLAEFRARGLPIVFTEFGSRTPDGGDLPPWARRMNELAVAAVGERCFLPLTDPAARVIGELQPVAGEEVFTKSTSGPLAGTSIHSHLAGLDADPVVVTGVMTDMCVTGMVRELADSGFDVILAGDACATFVQASHEWSTQFLGASFARAFGTDAVLAELLD